MHFQFSSFPAISDDNMDAQSFGVGATIVLFI
jgi:hypothetical protein